MTNKTPVIVLLFRDVSIILIAVGLSTMMIYRPIETISKKVDVIMEKVDNIAGKK